MLNEIDEIEVKNFPFEKGIRNWKGVQGGEK